MRYTFVLLIFAIASLGCEMPQNEGHGRPSLRLISVDFDCPFSQQTIDSLARKVFTELELDPNADATVSLNLFFSCLDTESGQIVDSRIHLGIELSSGSVVYYESPTFGGLYEIGKKGISVQQFFEITSETVAKALMFSIQPDTGELATRPQ